MSGKYVMSISRMTVDKLGVKLYDRVSAVIAELIANGYDADATEVTIEAPMGTYLASLSGGQVNDAGYTIKVTDNGCGMPPNVVNAFYLKVGAERRKDPARGDRSKKFNRRVMGRKGVGKLAPFGICNSIEVISSGGDLTDGVDEHGKPARGYDTAHFTMRRSDILSDKDEDYEPPAGPLDGTVQATAGSKFIMTDFIRRFVPEMPSFSRQLAQRFGMATADWSIRLVDTNLAAGTNKREKVVGDFNIDTMPNTKIVLSGPTTEAVEFTERAKFRAVGEDGQPVPGTEAGFVHTDGRFYPVVGWVAYAKESYRDELMAGIRIYCRGKIAAQTALFNRRSGFTGEHNIRSYLVGELHADWLDEGEDLIQTDRRDILWSDDLGQEFEHWGQRIVELLGTKSREPLKKKVWEEFLETGDVINRVESAYPGERWKSVRDTTMRIAKLMGERLRPGEAKDHEHVDSLVQLSLMLGPHVQLDEALKNAASHDAAPIAVMATILRTARIAELSSYGMIAEKRVQVIERIIGLKDDGDTLEQALQDSLDEAPWLINPLWSPITANMSLATVKSEFEKFYKQQTGQDIQLSGFDEKAKGKRPDFVLSADDFGLQIIEIKRPKHKLGNDEWDRIQTYIEQMQAFLDLPGHAEFKQIYKSFTVTVVCDQIGLTGARATAFEAFKAQRIVEHITWTGFLR
ncbi:MAG: ATP-binding protein, partial [Bauldia sp.]